MANTRLFHARDSSIVGIDAGGLMTANIQAGYDDILTSPADGNAVPDTDRATKFIRGTMVTQDWVEMQNIIAGVGDEIIFFEKESTKNTYTRNTLTGVHVHNATLNLAHRGYGTMSIAFECQFDVGDKFIDVWARDTAVAAAALPDLTAARGTEITDAVHSVAMPHILGLTLNMAGQLATASHDGDEGITAVDVLYEGTPITGTLTVQDSETVLIRLDDTSLVTPLVLTIKQSAGAAVKTITIANCVFTGLGNSSAAGANYTSYAMDFYVHGDTIGTPLTIANAVLIT